MAITVLQSPQSWQPAYNENVHVVVSTNANSYYRYKYICNIYDAFSNLLTTIKTPVYPTSTSGECYFNVGRIVENYLAETFSSSSGVILLDIGSSWNIYGATFGEEYATTSGGTVVPIAATGFTSVQYFGIWNACLEHPDLINYDADEFILQPTSGTGRWLTNQPIVLEDDGPAVYHECTNTEKGWVYGLTPVGYLVNFYAYYTFINTDATFENHYITINPTDSNMFRVPATYASAAEYFGINLPNIVTMYIQVSPNASGTSYIPNSFYHNQIIDGCGRYDRQRIHFLNKLGGYDSFTFAMKSEKSQDVERKSYQKKVGTLSAGRYSYSQYDQGSVIFDTAVKPKFYFNSDWLSEDQMNWLSELVSSPKVWLDGDLLTPLIINTNTFRFVKKQNEELFQLNFEASFSIHSNRQRS